MKQKCYLCGEEQEVGEECIEVVCDCCLIAGAPLYSENGIDYYSEEAMSDLLDKGKQDKVKVWEGAQELRDKGLSLRVIAKQCHTTKSTIQRHTRGELRGKVKV